MKGNRLSWSLFGLGSASFALACWLGSNDLLFIGIGLAGLSVGVTDDKEQSV